MRDISIQLSPDELYAGCAVACHRRISSIFKRTKGQHYESPDNSEWSTEIESAVAEMAVARHKNWYWSGSIWTGKVAGSDVNGHQVRHTHHPNGCLVLYEEDLDNKAFVLVTGRSPIFILRGWIYARDGKQDKFWKADARRPAWFVPQGALLEFNS